jgi:uncharacterized membrane protein
MLTATERRDGLAALRLGVGSVAGLAAGIGAAVAGADWQVAVSIGWCVFTLFVLTWVWATIGWMDADSTAKHARSEDFSHATADLVLLGASIGSLVAVAVTLVLAGEEHGARKVALITLTVLTVALSWLTIQTVYTVRYGDLYYRGRSVGGIDFNEDDKPDYVDFAYLAVTIGMTFQVSDTDLQAKPIRRNAIRHALLSYVFGAVIVAITINIVASLLSK